MSADSYVLKEPIRFRPGGHAQMIAALQKHSGIGAAETEESNAQEGSKRREGWDSQRGSTQRSPMLDAMGGLVKRY